MSFTPETAKTASQKSKSGLSKLSAPIIKEKMEIICEGVENHLH